MDTGLNQYPEMDGCWFSSSDDDNWNERSYDLCYFHSWLAFKS